MQNLKILNITMQPEDIWLFGKLLLNNTSANAELQSAPL